MDETSIPLCLILRRTGAGGSVSVKIKIPTLSRQGTARQGWPPLRPVCHLCNGTPIVFSR